MKIPEPGKVVEGLWSLGRIESRIHLLEGEEESMIISGGMSYIVPDILHQFNEFRIDEKKIKKLLILHAHFDHIGVVPFFKRRYNELEIYASSRGWEILQMQKAIKTINEFSKNVANKMDNKDITSRYDLDWRDDITGTSVFEGYRIDLGNQEVRIIETPGHSSCSISAYAPQIKTLFASDGGGIPYKDTIMASGNSNFTKFQQSLEKLKDLEVEYFCADHYGYVTGKEANNFIKHAIEIAKETREMMEKTYIRLGSIDAAVEEIVDSFSG